MNPLLLDCLRAVQALLNVGEEREGKLMLDSIITTLEADEEKNHAEEMAKRDKS